jgi:hypothetical protein
MYGNVEEWRRRHLLPMAFHICVIDIDSCFLDERTTKKIGFQIPGGFSQLALTLRGEGVLVNHT